MATLGERAISFFKKGAQNKEFVLAPNIYNKNLRLMAGDSETRKVQHQVLLTTVYNKVIFFHHNP